VAAQFFVVQFIISMTYIIISDLEYKTVKEIVTVKACKKWSAKWVAVKQAYGYWTHHWPRHIDWTIYDIVNVARIYKVKK
jgi:hypothetical protein